MSHYVPYQADWNQKGDLRQRIQDVITVPIIDPVNPHYGDSENDHPNFGFLYADWIHYDIAGDLTPEKFQEELDKGIKNFANQVDCMEEFRPVRIITQPSGGEIGFYDWRGEGAPFDVRVLVQAAAWEHPELKIMSGGLHFFITTLIQWDEKADEAFADIVRDEELKRTAHERN